jgi:CelD/BcsL family acetyltransferase involved in cellulose biosynthesis
MIDQTRHLPRTCLEQSEVRCVRDEEYFEGLRSDWNHLLETMPEASVFLSHEWLESAWAWARESGELYVLVACEGGKPLASLPLMRIKERRSGVVWRRLEFLTVPDVQVCDIVGSSDSVGTAGQQLGELLSRRRHEWDLLRITHIPEKSALLRMVDALKGAGLPIRVERYGENPGVDLGDTWKDYYGRRSRRLKKGNNNIKNRLERSGHRIELKWHTTGTSSTEEVAQALQDAITVSARSWKRGTGLTLDQPGPQAFISRLTDYAAARGWLSIWVMYLDDQPVATEYQLIHGGSVYALRADYDRQFEELSVGTYLNWRLMESLFDRGLEHYYMGPGDNPYKSRWSETAVPLYALEVFSPSARGRLLQALRRARRGARRLKDRLEHLRLNRSTSS